MNEQPNENPRLELESARAQLEAARGKDYWRSLEDLAGTEGFEEMLHREFPDQASEWTDVEGRRNFLKLMGASLGLAGLTACSRPPTEFIMPYVNQPREVVPGKPLFYATATTLGGVGTGVLVESHLGRPTKVEGNPEHPASLGACDPFSQASVLTLYDPGRSQALTHQDDIRSWGAFLGALREVLAEQRPKGGAGIRILTEAITSPSLADLIGTIQKDLPAMKWHQWEPAGALNGRAGSAMAFGQPYNVYYNLLNADTIVCLDSDLLGSGPAALRYAREFALRRRVRGEKTGMNRLYVLEPMPTPTGTKADHRLPVRAGTIERLAARLAASLGVGIGNPPPTEFPEFDQWLGPLVRELQQHRGRSLIVAGDYQPPAVHALVHAMNHALGNVGSTVFYTDPVEANPVDYTASLKELLQDLEAQRVDLLMILGGNPAYSAPADFPVANLAKARMARPPGPLPQRNHPILPVAPSGNAFPRNLGRRARLQRRCHHHAAPDPAALRQPFHVGGAGHADVQARAQRLRTRQGLLAAPVQGRRLRGLVARSPPCRHGAGYRAAHAHSGRQVRMVRHAAQAGRHGDYLPAGSDRLRRPLRQQYLASGTAQARHQAGLEQRGHHEPGHGAPAQGGKLLRGGADVQRTQAARARLRPARPRR